MILPDLEFLIASEKKGHERFFIFISSTALKALRAEFKTKYNSPLRTSFRGAKIIETPHLPDGHYHVANTLSHPDATVTSQWVTITSPLYREGFEMR